MRPRLETKAGPFSCATWSCRLTFAFYSLYWPTVEETVTASGSIASLGSPEPLAVVSRTVPEDSMQAHAENAAFPNDAWRIAPPIDQLPRVRMVRELHGVPRGALRTRFGKVLAKRIWEQVRRPRLPTGQTGTPEQGRNGPASEMLDVTDNELFVAMIESVSRRAAETLSQDRRQA